MGQDNAGKTPAQDHPQDDPQDQLQDHVQDQPVVDPLQDHQALQGSNTLATAGAQSSADDLLHAAHILTSDALTPDALPPEMIANVELTLDQLSTSVDLFDVSPFDYDAPSFDDGGAG